MQLSMRVDNAKYIFLCEIDKNMRELKLKAFDKNGRHGKIGSVVEINFSNYIVHNPKFITCKKECFLIASNSANSKSI